MSIIRLSYITALYFLFCKVKGNLPYSTDLPVQTEEQIIPKVFHTIWIDFGKGEEIFPQYLENMENLKNLHPDWELKLWTENEIVQLIENNFPHFLETFKSYDAPIKKHDSSRAVILYCYGGVYLDHDFLALKNIEPLLKSYDFVVGNEGIDSFIPCNAFLASTKGFPLLNHLVDLMNRPGVAENPVLEATGPAVLKQAMLEYCELNGMDGIKIYSNTIFFPVGWWEKEAAKYKSIENLREIYPFSYLIQEYDASWKD